MIDQIGQNKRIVPAVIFHVLLGFASSFTNLVAILWFFIFSATAVEKILRTRDRQNSAMFYLGYLMGIELLFRMAQTSPFIPYEVGKYAPFFILLLTLITGAKKSPHRLGLAIVILMLPSMLIYAGDEYIDSFVFTFLGMINLGLSVQYFHGRVIEREQFVRLIRTIMLPIISVLVFVTVKTPSFEDVNFELGANFATTGGFGSNQVSTLFGVGLALMAIAYFNKIVIFKKRSYDVVLIGYLFIRGLLTFSRGGILLAIFSILILIMASRLMRYKLPGFNFGAVLIFGFLLSMMALLANVLTDNSLLLRYEGETDTTLAGEKEKDLNTITTGRYELFVDEVRIFTENPILGTGPGGAQVFRREGHLGAASHSEYSRLLAENGIFGLIICFILTFHPFIQFMSRKRYIGKTISLALAILAVGMTFHAAMRTFVTPFLFGLSTAYIYITPHDRKNDKKS